MTETSPVDRLSIPGVRFILATSALLIGLSIPLARHEAMNVAFALYVGYSGVVCVLARRDGPVAQSIQSWGHWVDLSWYAVLIALSDGARDLLMPGLFFPILVASLWRGYTLGLYVTATSAVLFILVSLDPPNKLTLEFNHFLFCLIFLLAFGYLMARCGGLVISLRRRLTLLKEITSLSNPRFGIDRTINSILERLRAFYNAEVCLLIMYDPDTAEYSLRRADLPDPNSASRAKPIEPASLQLLLRLACKEAIVYRRRRRSWLIKDAKSSAYDLGTGKLLSHECQGIDKLYQAVVKALDQLVDAVGLKVA